MLKKRLSMNEPSIMAGNFAYEEGADLEPDEVAANARLLPVSLEELPGGGLKHGAIVSVSDQAQDFNCQLIVNHKARYLLRVLGSGPEYSKKLYNPSPTSFTNLMRVLHCIYQNRKLFLETRQFVAKENYPSVL